MNPTQSDVHVNTPLTNMSVAFLQNPMNFVARSVFPGIPSSKQSDRYYTFDRGDFFRDEMVKRAPATESAGGGYRVDNTPNFFCDVFAFHKDLDDQTMANEDAVVQNERATAEYLAHKALIRQEVDFASNFFTSGVWGTDITGAASSPGTGEQLHWNDAASTPIEDIAAAITAVEESTGYTPNKFTIQKHVYDALKNHPDVVDRIKYSGMTGPSGNPAKVSPRTLAELFEVEQVLVMRAVKNTAAEGLTNAHSFIGGKNALLTYSPSAPAVFTPSAGYTFNWTGYVQGANEFGYAVSSWYERKLKATRYECEMAYDQKVIAPELGYMWNGIVA